MWIGMYADQTGLFSESEINFDNWVEFDIPEEILRKWYEVNNLAEDTAEELDKPVEECTFEDWCKYVSCGDDTDGLYDFAIENGFTPKFNFDGNYSVFYRDEDNFKYIVFEGSYDECREFGRKNEWMYHDDNELEVLE